MKLFLRTIIFALSLMFFFGGQVVPVDTVQAAPSSTAPKTVTPISNSKNVTKVSGVVPRVTLTNPIKGNVTDIRIILGNVLAQALTLLGSIALLVFIVGGAYWLTSAGNADRVKKGSQTMVWAAVGLFVIFASYGMLAALIGGLTGGTVTDAGVTPRAVGAPAASTVTAVKYYVAAKEVDVFKEAKEGGKPLPKIPKSDCIKAIAAEKSGFLNVSYKTSSSDTPLTGWIKKSDVSDSKNKDCGGKNANAKADGSTGSSGITCEGVVATYRVITPDNSGLSIKDGPKANKGANVIGEVLERTVFNACSNKRSNTWGVVEYEGQVGWAYLNKEWLRPAECKEPKQKRVVDTGETNKKNQGLWVHTLPKSGVHITKMDEGAEFYACANDRVGSWGVVEYEGKVGSASLNAKYSKEVK